MKTMYQNKRCRYNKCNKYRKILRTKIAVITNQPYQDQMQMASVGNASAPNTGPKIALGWPT